MYTNFLNFATFHWQPWMLVEFLCSLLCSESFFCGIWYCTPVFFKLVQKGCFSVLLPTITKFVDLSLSTGRMPNALKVAALSPSLKNPDADCKRFSNFRPYNLQSDTSLKDRSLRKPLLRREQLTDHVKTFHLDEMYQSAFKVLHSTEMALLKVQNDILRAVGYTPYTVGYTPFT